MLRPFTAVIVGLSLALASPAVAAEPGASPGLAGVEIATNTTAAQKILVCPGCAKDAGLTSQSQLRTPASLGTMDSVATAILGARKIIDY